jgi:hypothetical protein
MNTPKTQQIEKVSIPFRRDYSIVFHDQDLYKVSVNAQIEGLQLLLISLHDNQMWKGEFPSEYLEDISRKTGRELAFVQFIQMMNTALTA